MNAASVNNPRFAVPSFCERMPSISVTAPAATSHRFTRIQPASSIPASASECVRMANMAAAAPMAAVVRPARNSLSASTEAYTAHATDTRAAPSTLTSRKWRSAIVADRHTPAMLSPVAIVSRAIHDGPRSRPRQVRAMSASGGQEAAAISAARNDSRNTAHNPFQPWLAVMNVPTIPIDAAAAIAASEVAHERGCCLARNTTNGAPPSISSQGIHGASRQASDTTRTTSRPQNPIDARHEPVR